MLLGANIIFTLASVPLALRYLNKAEFGLWALITQLAGYIALIDLGMSGSVARILVDYKDRPSDGQYGSVIQTGFLVTLTQGFLILCLSTGLFLFIGTLPGVPITLAEDFRWLMIGQCGMLAGGFLGRTFSNLLWAHQRVDVGNYAQIGTVLANFGVLWFCFERGLGLYSMLWGQAVATLVGLLALAVACVRLKLLPRPGQWGRPTWIRFRELFGFGKDFFLFSLGSQMIGASQTILVTIFLGLEAAAVWSICTRAYNVLSPLVWRLLDFSATSLSEMFVRGERDQFFKTFRDVTVLTAAMATVGAIGFATCNQSFVFIWTSGKISWSPMNDALLGVWAVLMAVQRCHCGLKGVKKELGTVKYIYFFEGILFMELAALFTFQNGFAAIISSSLMATFSLSFFYGQWSTKSDFNLTWRELLGWLLPAGKIAVVLIPLAFVMRWLSQFLSPVGGSILTAGALGIVGGWLLIRWALTAEMRQRLRGKMPKWLSAFV